MNKIKDRVILGIFAGSIGVVAQNVLDEISHLLGISKRSYRTTAAGVWVSSRKEAESWQGQLLGLIKNQALGMLGAIQLVKILSNSGRKHWLWKGLFYGETFGAVITGLLSALPVNKIKANDASSVLSYCFTNAIYGVVVAGVITKYGDESLFGTKPKNNDLKPASPMSKQREP
jgi:Vitamin K epoxide reductase family.